MKRILLSIFILVTVFSAIASAQILQARKVFEDGMISARKGEFKTALAKFEKSLELAKSEESSNNFRAKIHFNIGVCFYQMKEQKKAVTEFERAILFDENYEKAFYSLGMAQFELRNFNEAEKAFLGAIRQNGKNGETWFDLAFVYLAQKNFGAAHKAFEKSIKLKSVDASISHNNLGVIFAIGGDFGAAVKQFEAALKKSNGDFPVAEKNLQFCKSLAQDFNRDLLAQLKFERNK